MEFGVFDHVDRNNEPLADFYENRLKFAEVCDRLGFYSYHIAEHHFTPLGMASCPSVFLAALAQRTQRLRFGPMVYTLPLHHPLRVAEEICMLDQMSRGRLEVGVGRGISPIEARYYGSDQNPETSRQIFAETLDIVLAAMTQKRVEFQGKHRTADNVPMELEPYQRPHPPLWLGVTSDDNLKFAARYAMNFLCIGYSARMRERVARYRQMLRDLHPGEACDPKMGMLFFVVVADTDAEANEIAERAYRHHHRSFHHLYHLHGQAPVWGERAADFRSIELEGRAIAGSPETVARYLAPKISESNANYLVGQFMFGDMTLAEAQRSVELFASKVKLSLLEPVLA